ncbi:hypothetical protein BOTNAR_0159g00250 [Botryotinia narcissicola]|uniref:Uncharacterized protein n=1 Tax=Botryotinia narcissicola TaxID=278944 RepID=A0A4Z1IE53_9HELO|nr:hypothetical protein BOTNAR_0159g00250 [Botryotinia narcissicola]
MSRFHSSSSTGSAPGAGSSNSTNMSAPRGRGYQVPQTSNSLHPPSIHPPHVPYVCDQQMEPSLDPSTIYPLSNRPGNLSSSTTSASTQAKKTKKKYPLSLRLISSSSASSSYYSDSCGSYESIDWSALEIKPHPMATKRYRSPTMYSDSIQEDHTSSDFTTGSSGHFPIGSPCINVGLLLDVKPPPPRPFVTDATSDSLDYPITKASPPMPFVADDPLDPFLDHPIALPSGSGISTPPPKTRYVFREATPSPGITLSSKDSFSAHHTVSISSGSPSMASIALDPFNSHSCSSSVLAEDGSNPSSPVPSPSPSPFPPTQLPVVHMQPRFSSLAKPKTFTQVYLQQPRCFSRAKPKTFTQRWSEMILEEQVLESRAHIITPVRPLSQSPMATSDSGCELVSQSTLSDFFCISREPSPSPEPIPSPSSQAISRRNFNRFHDARPFSSSSSSEDESDTTADYPSSLDDDPLDTPEPETTPWTIARVQSWISRNSSTIKTVARWTIVAAAIILPKILWKWWPEMIHVLVVLAGNPQVRG